MKRILLLDVNGPLGNVTKIWVTVAHNILPRRTFDLLMDRIKAGKGYPDTFWSRLSKTSASVELQSMVHRYHTENGEIRSKFEEKLREHLGNKDIITAVKEFSRRFDHIVLYTDMPHSVAESVAKVLRELTGVEVKALGSPIPPYPVPYKQTKMYREGRQGYLESGTNLWARLREVLGLSEDEELHVVYVSDETPDRNAHINPEWLKKNKVVYFAHFGNVTRKGDKGLRTLDLAHEIHKLRPHFEVRA